MTEPSGTRAADLYAQRSADITALVSFLQSELAAHAERAGQQPDDWSLVGDLGEIRSRLMDVLSFISGMPVDQIAAALEDLR